MAPSKEVQAVAAAVEKTRSATRIRKSGSEMARFGTSLVKHLLEDGGVGKSNGRDLVVSACIDAGMDHKDLKKMVSR